MADKPRYLGKLGYVESSMVAIDKLECISATEQRRQTADAHRHWKREQQREWGHARQQILAAVDAFSAVADTQLRRNLRPIRRQVDLISRELGV